VREVWQSTAVPAPGTAAPGTALVPGDSGQRPAGAEPESLQVIVREVWQSTAVSTPEAGDQGTV
jgi:hypothetical protein